MEMKYETWTIGRKHKMVMLKTFCKEHMPGAMVRIGSFLCRKRCPHFRSIDEDKQIVYCGIEK